MKRLVVFAGAAAVLGVLSSAPAQAQSIGTLTWQLQPYCNRVTLTITQNGGIYTLDGFDDQCGAAQRAPLVGIATPNPDGSIGFGLNIVTVPSGRSVHVESRVSLGTLGGPWTDSAGNSGTLVFNGAAAGAARPAPTVSGAVLATGTIPGAALANGAVGSAQIANGAVGNAQIATNAVSSTQTSNEPGINSNYTQAGVTLGVNTSVISTALRVPADGFVKIEVTGSFINNPGDAADCQLQKGTATAIDTAEPRFFLRDRSANGLFDSFSAHRVVPVAVADNPVLFTTGQNFRLVCNLGSGAMAVSNVHISATYYPTSYAPISLVVLPDTLPQQ